MNSVQTVFDGCGPGAGRPAARAKPCLALCLAAVIASAAICGAAWAADGSGASSPKSRSEVFSFDYVVDGDPATVTCGINVDEKGVPTGLDGGYGEEIGGKTNSIFQTHNGGIRFQQTSNGVRTVVIVTATGKLTETVIDGDGSTRVQPNVTVADMKLTLSGVAEKCRQALALYRKSHGAGDSQDDSQSSDAP